MDNGWLDRHTEYRTGMPASMHVLFSGIWRRRRINWLFSQSALPGSLFSESTPCIPFPKVPSLHPFNTVPSLHPYSHSPLSASLSHSALYECLSQSPLKSYLPFSHSPLLASFSHCPFHAYFPHSPLPASLSHSPLPPSLSPSSLPNAPSMRQSTGSQLKLRYISGHGHYFWLMTRFSTTPQNVDVMRIFGNPICLKKLKLYLRKTR